MGATSAAAQGSSSDATTAGASRDAATAEEEASSEIEEASPEPSREEDLPPQLRAPSIEGLELPQAPASANESEEEFDESAFDEDEMASDDAKLLGMAEPPASDPTLATWTNPRPVFSLNGYFRVRGEYMDNFALGRVRVDRLGPGDPFARWIQLDNAPSNDTGGVQPAGGCKGEPSSVPSNEQRCDGSATTRFANMRLRLQPTLSLSDNIRVHM
ncbi:MAG: hypothetical protein WBN29_16805, partial [Polyangiales bacterium]